MYIVLYADGAMTPLANKPRKEDHQNNARFFFAKDDMTLLDLSAWYANNFKPTYFRNKQKGKTRLINELEKE